MTQAMVGSESKFPPLRTPRYTVAYSQAAEKAPLGCDRTIGTVRASAKGGGLK